MRTYQASHLSSLAALKGAAIRRSDKREIMTLAVEYKVTRFAYAADARLRSTVDAAANGLLKLRKASKAPLAIAGIVLAVSLPFILPLF